VDTTKNITRRTLCLVASALVLILVSSGCPRKLTEKVPVPCNSASGPAPSVHSLATATVLGAGENQRAVVTSGDYAAVVRVNEKVGSEQAVVQSIRGDEIRAVLSNGQVVVIDSAPTETASEANASASSSEATAPSGPVQPQRLVAWRTSLLDALRAGGGVPHSVFMALSLALGDTERPSVKSAMEPMGWEEAPGIEKIYLTRFHLANGRVRVEGVAPTEKDSTALVRRLRSAAPYIRQVSGGNGRNITEGHQFNLSFQVAGVRATDIAKENAAMGAATPLPMELRETLRKATVGLPTSQAVPGADQGIRRAAEQFGLQVTQLRKHPQPVEEGALGRVAFDITASGSMKAVIPFLQLLQDRSNKNPLVMDPVTIEASTLRATIHVAYSAGGTDSRSPAPNLIQVVPTNLPKWSRARRLSLDAVRNPFARR